MTLYIAEILGANSSPAQCTVGGVLLGAVTHMSTDWAALRVVGRSYSEPSPVALFRSRGDAQDSADAAVWNGQISRVRAARGRNLSAGVVVDSHAPEVLP